MIFFPNVNLNTVASSIRIYLFDESENLAQYWILGPGTYNYYPSG